MICYKSDTLIIWEILEDENQLISLLGNYPDNIKAEKNNSHRLQTLATSIIIKTIFHDELCHMRNGRPFLKSSLEKISISNTGKYVALSHSNDRVGVDIELISRNATRVIRRVATETEISLACKLYPRNGELLLWCLKEAAYKMIEHQPEGMALEFQKLISVDTINKCAVMKTSEGEFNMTFFEFGDILVVHNN